MKFGSILDLFRQDNWSNELADRIGEMLELGRDMFTYTAGVVVEGKEDTDPQTLLYDRDKRINHLERKIRRRIVSHLSMTNQGADIPSALIFTNVVKDGERIGDYIKNMHEVRAMMPESPDWDLYRKWLGPSTETIQGMFTTTHGAFQESDAELAGKVIKQAKNEGREHERLIREVTTSDLATPDAVCLVLVLRFFKRMVAHMSNIASTVVMPVDMIDFYDEPEK